MTISKLISPNRIQCKATASSKKRALELVSQLLAANQSQIDESKIFEKLIERERLGSTGLGAGVALPHTRIEGINKPLLTFITLQEGIDFDAVDKQPVDMILALLVPQDCNDTHLQILASAAEMFSDKPFCDLLRCANTSQNLFELLSHWSSGTAMAV